MNETYDDILVNAALAAREAAYAPYSRFKVGAALLCANGGIVAGCNIENAGYSATNCAERTAFFIAVGRGAREFTAIAVAGGRLDTDQSGYAYPCGVCLQVMMEFCDPAAFRIIVAAGPGDYRAYTLAELLPHGFGPGNLRVASNSE